MPAVSIIVNVCNGAATLREALQSALTQTYTDWEMIVWDDCSSDDSASIAYCLDDPRIRYFLAPKPAPLGQAREAAIHEARGEWLAFLDQDDVWLPDKLERQLALSDSASLGLIYGRTLDFWPDGRQRDHDYFHEFTRLPEGNIVEELLGRGCFIAMSSAVMSRSFVLEAGSIPNEIRMTPDYFLYVSVCSRHEVRAVQQVICRSRVHPGSMTKTYRRESLEESLWLVDRCRERLDPSTYQRRRVRISTALAVEEIRHPETAANGLRRLVEEGSMVWLAGRPFVFVWRRLRRLIRRPYWKMSAEAS
jgi:glycosyltransferase involved in cell wall biosynthesis